MSIPDGTIKLDAGGNYGVLFSIFSHLGTEREYVGSKGKCRFCGETDPKKFRTEAHTFPHFFQSDKIFSLDECDECNKKFSQNEGALAERILPFLTLGGVKGKTGKSPQTGRSAGTAVIRESPGTPRSINFAIKDEHPSEHLSIDPATGKIRLKVPIPTARYIPQLAYKALAKMGMAILPEEHLRHFENLRAWLVGEDQAKPPRTFEVVTSYANIMNPAPIIQGVILTRLNDDVRLPNYVFVLAAGALCFQIALETDNESRSEIIRPFGRVGICWAILLGDSAGAPKLKMNFYHQNSEDWSSPNLEARAFQAIDLDIQLSRGLATPK